MTKAPPIKKKIDRTKTQLMPATKIKSIPKLLLKALKNGNINPRRQRSKPQLQKRATIRDTPVMIKIDTFVEDNQSQFSSRRKNLQKQAEKEKDKNNIRSILKQIGQDESGSNNIKEMDLDTPFESMEDSLSRADSKVQSASHKENTSIEGVLY